MSLTAATTRTTTPVADEDQSPSAAEIHLPADIDWEMLDKSRFFLLGAALFSGVSGALYPAVVLKTRLQVSRPPLTCAAAASSILRCEGPRGFYRGFATSLTGTIPARALYMGALEVTKSAVGAAAVRFGVPDPAAAAASNAAAGLSAAVAAQIVWTPIDVVSQRLMVRDSKYTGGIDAVRKIVRSDGIRGLYRGFGMSILTYAPSNAVWWASYSISQRLIWNGIGYYYNYNNGSGNGDTILKPSNGTVAVVQGVSAAMAGGAAAVVTMPLDTITTRMQVMDGDEYGGKKMGIARTVRVLLREGGWGACYRGLGPRWASMSLSATTMITTYEFLKRLSAKGRYSITKAFCVAFVMTFFSIFDVPVFWPILLFYWIVLFVLTMKRQLLHMIKYKYIPISIGKQLLQVMTLFLVHRGLHLYKWQEQLLASLSNYLHLCIFSGDLEVSVSTMQNHIFQMPTHPNSFLLIIS